jgi:hypothetical protein
VVHVRVALHHHQLVDANAAGLADPAQVVALQVDEHDVLGALLRVRHQLAHARGIVVAGQPGPRARDRPRLHHPAAHRHQPLGRRARQRPARVRQQPGEGRRVRRAQPRVLGRRLRRRLELGAPLARQVHLEDIARAQVLVHALDAGEEARRIVFLDQPRRLPGRQRRQRARGGEFGFDVLDQRFCAGLAHQHAAAAVAVARDRGGTAQCQRHGQRAGSGGQAQHRLDLAGEFVTEIQRPAAVEGQAVVDARSRAGVAPGGVEQVEEVALQRVALEIAGDAVGVQSQAGTVRREQLVPTRVAAGDALEQQRPACRRLPVQREQIAIGGQRAHARAARHRCWRGRVQILRNTRVPLVPPKPKPFDIATSIFFSRATFGT